MVHCVYIFLFHNTYIEILTYIMRSCIILYSFDEYAENLQEKSLCIDDIRKRQMKIYFFKSFMQVFCILDQKTIELINWIEKILMI